MQKQTAAQEFNSILNDLAYRKGIREVFTDLIDLSLCGMVLHDEMNLKRNPLKDYEEKDRTKLICLMTCMGEIMTDDGTGLHDALGDLFMEYLSFGKNGQFFTPQPICDMMTSISFDMQEIKAGQTVNDCACGSGRMLLAAAKISKEFRFYGSDIDLTCVKMAVINLAMNNLRGEISWADPLTMNHYASFRIEREIFSGFPVIYVVDENKSEQFGRRKIPNQETKVPNQEINLMKKEIILDSQPERIEFQQLSLFVD